jgi:hypothetical protein
MTTITLAMGKMMRRACSHFPVPPPAQDTPFKAKKCLKILLVNDITREDLCTTSFVFL